MKTTITADGTLTISAETELEAYALRQWGAVSFTEPTGDQPSQFVGKLKIDGSVSKDNAATHYSGQTEIISNVIERMSGHLRREIKQLNQQPFMYADLSLALTNSARAVLEDYQK